MLYNEEYILSKIRDLQSQVLYLSSRLSSLSVIIQVGGVSQLMHGSGLPAAAPSNPALAALYVDDDTNIIYIWKVASQTWE